MPAAVAQIAGALGKSNGNTEGVYNLYPHVFGCTANMFIQFDSTNADEGCNQQKIGDCTKVLPSGKQPHNYGKSPFFMGNSTISMAMFNSYVKRSLP